jgi:4-amino-4-deoxychorismate lyase
MITTLVNGDVSETVSVNNRGLAYGDGLFETLKVTAGKVIYLDLHLQRLQSGLARLNISCDTSLVEQEIELILSEAGAVDGIVKIIVTRAFCGRGYKSFPDAGCDRIISLTVGGNDFQEQQKNGVNVRLCDVRLAMNPALAGIKHLARLENVLARAEWSDNVFAEGVLLDMSGRVIEGTMSNLFFFLNNRLVTPSLKRCGVEGIVRHLIINQLSPKLGLTVHEIDMTMDDLVAADEMFLCNSLIGIWPVTSVAGNNKVIGTITRQLQQLLQIDRLP